MSLFEDDRYSWRETYFVLFDPARRPRLRDLRRELRKHSGTFRILEASTDPSADADGTLASMTIASYEDHSALEIHYREGNDITGEVRGLIETLENGCSAKEMERLKQAARCRAKFDVLHFEQTAGTAAFKIVKMPELRFAPPEGRRTSFPKEQRSDKLNAGRRFHFDPDSYENCVNDGAGAELDEQEFEAGMDSSIIERVDPNTLVLFLEILCRTTDGIAIDPASGVVI